MGDAAVRAATLLELQGFAGRAGGTADALALVESAGGPASPMPSGTLQVSPQQVDGRKDGPCPWGVLQMQWRMDCFGHPDRVMHTCEAA